MTIERCIKMSELHILFVQMQLHKAQSGGMDLTQIARYEEDLQFYLYVNAILNKYKNNGGN